MRRTKAEAAETRASILVAAEHMFFVKGVVNTTLDEIAAEAGVTRGAIYWHFASKTELFLELYDALRLPQAASMVDLQQSVCQGRDTLAVIERSCVEWLALLSKDKQRQRMMTILLRTNFTEEFHPVLQAMRSLDEMLERNLETFFEKAASEGGLAAEWTPKTSCDALKWLMKGVCWEWLLSGNNFDLADDGGNAVRRLFASFRQVTT
jgi:TetR/AcrR family acrAB operon transcriptional repressor